MILIGLAGQAGTGKDTVADMLIEMFGWKKFSFSDALYDEVAEAFKVDKRFLMAREYKEAPAYGLALENCWELGFINSLTRAADYTGEPMRTWLERPRSPRWILQKWGTEYRRGQSQDYWLRRAEVRIDAEQEKGTPGLANTSVRFPNEAELIRRRGGSVVHLTRDVPAVEGHVSEQPVPNYPGDWNITNNGSLAELRNSVIDLYGELLKEQYNACAVSD